MFNKTLNPTELIYFINNDSIELEFRLNNSSSIQPSAKLNQFKWFLWALFILSKLFQLIHPTSLTFNFYFLKVIFFTAFGNLLVIIAVYRERKLQTSTNFFLISLAIADFMVALFVMPTSLLVDILNYYPFNPTFCVLWIVLDVLCCTSSIYHMSAMAVDRFLKIKFPFKFGIDKSKRNTLLKIGCVWLMSICICLPLLLLGFWDKTNVFDSSNRTCMLFNKSFRIYGSLLAFYIPFFIMLVAYASTIHILKQAVNKKLDENKSRAKITRKGAVRKLPAHKSESSEPKHHQCKSKSEDCVNLIKSKRQTEIEIINGRRVLYVKSVDFVPNSPKLHTDSYIDALNSPTSPNVAELDEMDESLIKSKRKSKSKFSFSSHTQSQHHNQDIGSLQSAKSVANNERKALKVLLIIFVIFVTLWCPFFTFNTLSAICESCIGELLGRYEALFFSIINWLGYFSSMLNPLVYTMFNKSFRTAFKNILRMNKKSSSSVANFISYGAK
jgi:hypothetical protein